MKIDWKYVATTDGYKSLKAGYVESVQALNNYGRKYKRYDFKERQERLYKKFTLIISRAKHFAKRKNVSFTEILDDWEDARAKAKYSSSMGDFYYEYGILRKHTSGVLKQEKVNGLRARLKSTRHFSAIDVKQSVNKEIMREQKNSSTKTPERWTAEQKRRAYRKRR